MQGKENIQGESRIPQLMTAQDVAGILRIASKTVHKLVREGKLGCVQVTTRERRFSEEQVQQYIDARSNPIPVDTPRVRQVSSNPKKGGEKSSRVFNRADLLKEIRSWQ